MLAKCFHARLWENSLFVSKQLPGIGIVLSTALVAAGKTNFPALLEANPRDLERVIRSTPNHMATFIYRNQNFADYESQGAFRQHCPGASGSSSELRGGA